MSATSISSTLDHIVLLLPHTTLSNLPSWITDSFTVLDGGRHTNGITENKLVIFSDGTYIELIAFVDGVDPEKRAATRWGQKAEGEVVDWALTLLERDGEQKSQPERFFPEIQASVNAAQTHFSFADPVGGGRTAPDGTELRWAISAPRTSSSQHGVSGGTVHLDEGELPFWCLDRTLRRLRVPHLTPEKVNHACLATGVAGISVRVDSPEQAIGLSKVYNVILGSGAKPSAADSSSATFRWELQVPVLKSSPQPAHLTIQSTETNAVGVETSYSNSRGGPGSARVTITLFARTKNARTLSGDIGNGQILDISIIPESI
ncbi:glyoxalase [Lasiosphaeria ovina]|uniref:Glyoxalase n=1 Tax=Lasiosphaeria ovina TaxID=92902 RepID=A0AAE0K454_9PEZI|nr:glyoxalase [Lasiosphaeria ovina]